LGRPEFLSEGNGRIKKANQLLQKLMEFFYDFIIPGNLKGILHCFFILNYVIPLKDYFTFEKTFADNLLTKMSMSFFPQSKRN